VASTGLVVAIVAGGGMGGAGLEGSKEITDPAASDGCGGV